MFQRTRYLRNSFSLTFPRQPDIRRKANDFEDALKEKLQGHYSQPQVIAVPDELDAEVPRLIFASRHGFSQIIISQVSIVLNVTYSPDWQSDIEKGRDYLSERVKVLYELLSVLNGIRPYFSGLTTHVRLVSNADDKQILEDLSKLWTKDCFDGLELDTTHELLLKMTTVHSERFFSNMTVRNYRGWTFEGAQTGIRPSPSAEASERGVEIIGDFNDRYAYNEKNNYFSESAVADEIISGGLNEIKRVIAEIGGAS